MAQGEALPAPPASPVPRTEAELLQDPEFQEAVRWTSTHEVEHWSNCRDTNCRAHGQILTERMRAVPREICGTCGGNGHGRFTCPFYPHERLLSSLGAQQRMRRAMQYKRAWGTGDREDPEEPPRANTKKQRSDIPITIISDNESDNTSEGTTRHKPSGTIRGPGYKA